MGNQNLRTPRCLFDMLSQRFGPFALDAFASEHDALCPLWLGVDADGTKAPWVDITFANPPFALAEECLEHATEESKRGVRSCIVLPIGGSQRWYHEYAARGTIYVPDKRISFDNEDGTPTKHADRDTIIVCLGGVHNNTRWVKGEFCVRSLGVRDHLAEAA